MAYASSLLTFGAQTTLQRHGGTPNFGCVLLNGLRARVFMASGFASVD